MKRRFWLPRAAQEAQRRVQESPKRGPRALRGTPGEARRDPGAAQERPESHQEHPFRGAPGPSAAHPVPALPAEARDLVLPRAQTSRTRQATLYLYWAFLAKGPPLKLTCLSVASDLTLLQHEELSMYAHSICKHTEIPPRFRVLLWRCELYRYFHKGVVLFT